jgi:hypothetical protein
MWLTKIARWSAFIGARVGVLCAIGYAGVWASDALGASLVANVGPLPYWFTLSAGFLKIATMGYAALFVIRPFMEDPMERPGRLEGIVYPVVFALCVALDARPADVAGVLWFGVLATMRHSWFHIKSSQRSTSPRSILGLR